MDGRAVGRVTLDNAGYVEKSFGVFDLRPGQRLEVVYVNDAYGGNDQQDRNAVVDTLILQPR